MLDTHASSRKNKKTHLLNIYAVAGATEDQRCSHCFGKTAGLGHLLAVKTVGEMPLPPQKHGLYLIRYLLLLFTRQIHEMVILGSDQNWDGRLVEAPSLAIPFLDAVQCALACQIEHE